MTSSVSTIREVEQKFMAEHYRDLQETYSGQWIVLEGQVIAAADPNQSMAMDRARKAGIAVPYVVFIRPQDAPPLYA